MCRFVCAVFMHITLSDELRQSFDTMKYALNHPWKFRSWSMAYRVGLSQMLIVISLEVVNMAFMMTSDTITDIIKDFLALLIISDFDDYFFTTVDKTPMGKLISQGQLEVSGMTLSLDELTKIETTTSNKAPRDILIGEGEKIFEGASFQTEGVGKDVYTVHNN